ncbi:MAG: hypothetical protein ACE361_16235 [Aureliella sp.]
MTVGSAWMEGVYDRHPLSWWVRQSGQTIVTRLDASVAPKIKQNGQKDSENARAQSAQLTRPARFTLIQANSTVKRLRSDIYGISVIAVQQALLAEY